MVAVSLVILFSPSSGGPPWFPNMDKVVHISLFALLVMAACGRFRATKIVVASASAYAALSEVIQWLFLPHRSGDVRDAAADLLGVAVGAAVVGWRRRSRTAKA